MSLLAGAVSNNVDWCALVCGSGGIADPAAGVWLAQGSPPPLFPDAVTLRAGVAAERLGALLADRPQCAVKDSFADVDLEPYGLRELFTARWIGLRHGPSAAGSPRWSRIADTAGLDAWCAAAQLPEPLPAALLRDRSVRILAASRGGALAAGAIVNRSAAVVGLSNVFQVGAGERWVWRQVAGAAAQRFPGLPIVGYEHGADLGAALAAGFADLGPVRVWARS
jgi:hypothetical protein